MTKKRLEKRYEKYVNEFLKDMTPRKMAQDFMLIFPLYSDAQAPYPLPVDRATMQGREYLEPNKKMNEYMKMFGLASPDAKITRKVTLKYINEGSYNNVFKTNLKSPYGGYVALRMSVEELGQEDLDLRVKEDQFTVLVSATFPGKVTEYTYFADPFKKYPFELKEGYDYDLYGYLEKTRSLQKQYEALDQAFKAIDKLVDLGLYCFDIKPENFLVKVGRPGPVDFQGEVTSQSVFVRVTDLGADFCTRDDLIFSGPMYTESTFKTIMYIQLLFLAWDQEVNDIVVQKIAQEHGLCLDYTRQEFSAIMKDLVRRVHTQKEKSKKVDWIAVYETFKHYTNDGRKLNPTQFQNKFLEPACENSLPKSPPPRAPKQKNKNKTKKPANKACKGRTPKGKICNPKSGRYVDRNGKIGRALRGKASPPPRKRKPKRKACKGRTPKGKICNPKSGRYVDRNGKIGKELRRKKR